MLFTFSVRDKAEDITYPLRSSWRDLPNLMELYGIDPYQAIVERVEDITMAGAKAHYHPLTNRIVVSGAVAGRLLSLLRNAGFRADRCTSSVQASYTLELADLIAGALGAGDIPCAPVQAVAPNVVWNALLRAENDLAGIREELKYTEGSKAPYLLRALVHGMDRVKALKTQYGEQLAAYQELRAGHRIPLLDGRIGIATRINEQSVSLAMQGGEDLTVPFGKIDMLAYNPGEDE